jgi:hypothetical protein
MSDAVKCPKCHADMDKPRDHGALVAYVCGLIIGFILGLVNNDGYLFVAIGYAMPVGLVIGTILLLPCRFFLNKKPVCSICSG